MRRSATLIWITTLATAAGLSLHADTGEVGTDFSVTAIRIGAGDLESGGEMESRHTDVRVGIDKPLGRGESIGVSFGAATHEYDFAGSTVFGQAEPWGDITETTVGFSWRRPSGDSGMWYVAPSVGFAREDGADWGDSIQYGAIVSYGMRRSDNLTIGIGAGVFHGMEETTGFPVLLVDWKISDRWRMGNPFRPGPTGPAGLELVYRVASGVEAAIGAGWRSTRFRLDEDGPYAGGVAEVEGFPAFLRLTWFASDILSLDAFGGMLLEGEVIQEDESGVELFKEELDSAPFAALSVKAMF